ncbi:hypothetical protein VTN96DRAFT_4517 [Rasamsonia emersonii]
MREKQYRIYPTADNSLCATLCGAQPATAEEEAEFRGRYGTADSASLLLVCNPHVLRSPGIGGTKTQCGMVPMRPGQAGQRGTIQPA